MGIASLLTENLRALRKSRGFTQESLAEAAGMSLGGYQQIEYQRRWPSDATLDRIARALGVPSSAFFSDKNLSVKPTLSQALDVLTDFIRLAEKSPVKKELWSRLSALDESEAALLLEQMR